MMGNGGGAPHRSGPQRPSGSGDARGRSVQVLPGQERPGGRLSPVSLVLIGIMSVQFGAAVSKSLFGEIPPVGMVLLRLLTSSLILLDVSVYWQDMIKGCILLAAVSIDHLLHKRKAA